MALRVSGGFFQATGIELVAGRFPTDAELDTHARVVVVSESVARSYWPDRDAVGQALQTGRDTYVVVGVVRDARFLSLDLPPTGEIYTSIMAFDPGLSAVRLFLALGGDPQSSLNAVVAHVADTHPAWRVTDGELVETSLARSIQPRRFSAFVASSFGGVAAVFVVVGMMGLVAMSTSRRTREIGVRMALGSTAGRVVTLVFREQLASVVLGLAFGAALAAWAVEFLRSYLFGVTAFDAGVWLAAVALVLASAAAGVLVPAVRASRVDPIEALRTGSGLA
jgi:ABC-type antimicrobial peptide transport system permease subunit